MIEDLSVERIAENQSRFRHANEQIESAADHMRLVGPIPFVCECARDDCTLIVELTFDEYEEIRRFPRLFFTALGHEVVSVESGAGVVVGSGDGGAPDRYVKVEKVGAAGALADARYRELST
jgi:hypothetical protein